MLRFVLPSLIAASLALHGYAQTASDALLLQPKPAAEVAQEAAADAAAIVEAPLAQVADPIEAAVEAPAEEPVEEPAAAPAEEPMVEETVADEPAAAEMTEEEPAAPEPVAEPAVEEEEPAVEETPAEEEPTAAVAVPTVEAPSVEEFIEAPMAVVASSAPVCCPIEVVDVRTKLSARRFLRCAGAPVNMTVCVKNPAECCSKLYAVPLCVPCCCVGEPQQCNAHAGLLGRGYVDLVWDCGLVAKVTFLKHGGVIITYRAG